MLPSFTERNRPAAEGGPKGVQRTHASQLKESEALFNSYEHLQGLQRSDEALKMLRKIASLVKPIMRKRGWTVQILAEFLPTEQMLLGLNVNRGYRICIRLRYHNNPDLFLPEEQVVDTMLHELCHNVWGDHDSNFHALWEELRDEHEVLVRKGYTGEGFLSAGHRLGGGRHGVQSLHETRRLARASAEKRQVQGALSKGSGQRLGGTPVHLQGRDIRQVIADKITQRNTINKGCASGRQDAGKLSDQAASGTFKTQAEEDDANDRAISQALFELMELEEERKLQGTFSSTPSGGGLGWSPETGLYDSTKEPQRNKPSNHHPSEDEQLEWAMRDSSANTIQQVPDAHPRSPVSSLSSGDVNRDVSSRPVSAATSSTTRNQPSRDQMTPLRNEPLPAKRRRTQTPSTSRNTAAAQPPPVDISDPHDPEQWTCGICTLVNPLHFLACGACGIERPQTITAEAKVRTQIATSVPRFDVPKAAQKARLGWNCGRCGAFMEHKWWTCSACGDMKTSS